MVVKVNHVIARCGMLLAISRVQLWRCSILRHRFSSTCNTFRRAGTGDQSRWSISLLGFSEKTKISTDWFPRAAWDEPAPTLKCEVGATRRGPAHCHPNELRALSVEECVAIQTFPPGFMLAGSRNQQHRQTGECGPGAVRASGGEELVSLMERRPILDGLKQIA